VVLFGFHPKIKKKPEIRLFIQNGWFPADPVLRPYQPPNQPRDGIKEGGIPDKPEKWCHNRE
jgi:hypothetical protein